MSKMKDRESYLANQELKDLQSTAWECGSIHATQLSILLVVFERLPIEYTCFNYC